MAVEARPELVGKRFLCVSGDEPPEIGDIIRLPWRSGVIRAVSNRDSTNSDLTVRNVGIFILPCGILHETQMGKSVVPGEAVRFYSRIARLKDFSCFVPIDTRPKTQHLVSRIVLCIFGAMCVDLPVTDYTRSQ